MCRDGNGGGILMSGAQEGHSEKVPCEQRPLGRQVEAMQIPEGAVFQAGGTEHAQKRAGVCWHVHSTVHRECGISVARGTATRARTDHRTTHSLAHCNEDFGFD